MRATRSLAIVICLGGLLGLTGCEQARPIVSYDRRPQLDADGAPRSLVVQTPLLQHLQARESASVSLPWYADRNDRSLAADAGYQLPTLQDSVTITRDRQYHNNGRVRDHFSSTTYSAERRRAVR